MIPIRLGIFLEQQQSCRFIADGNVANGLRSERYEQLSSDREHSMPMYVLIVGEGLDDINDNVRYQLRLWCWRYTVL